VGDDLVIMVRTYAVNENVALPLRKITESLSQCGQMLAVYLAVKCFAICLNNKNANFELKPFVSGLMSAEGAAYKPPCVLISCVQYVIHPNHSCKPTYTRNRITECT
jgi:hypothetical protein